MDTTRRDDTRPARVKARVAFGRMSPNFITPDPVEFGRAGRYHYEIAEGTDMEHRRIFGVSLIEVTSGRLIHADEVPHPRVFDTLAAAQARADEIAGLEVPA